ncbi:hypothetical protein CTAYLR_008361 [Chrysophaeum taylorii]|uniref:Protein CLP1 homolog n=1 Tax=Chrysophaeum taylorii TaxID=2483200 RepID=A0AAD7UM75_9STRA|nr:hypothetical protein CTAYLR_008361 [Chrysophaeum taylorii]
MAGKSWTLEQQSELRLEVGFESWVTIVLKQGTAEVRGIELAANREYTFSGCNLAVFTWHGCGIETRGVPETIYQTSRGETTAAAALNAHTYLEARREAAARAAARDVVEQLSSSSSSSSSERPLKGPRVMVVGPTDSGKSTLCQTLVAYAARMGRDPIYVDLDPSLNDCGVPPGGVAALRVEKTFLSVEEGFSSLACAPVAYWFGYESPSENEELYRHVVDRLALAVSERVSDDARANAAGVVINTCGWVDTAGLGVLKHVAASFAVDVVLVLAHDRLYQDLKAAVPAGVVVANLPRSRGVVDRNPQHRRRARHNKVHDYFYGPRSRDQSTRQDDGSPGLVAPLAPSTLELRFRDVKIFKVLARDAAAVDSMLPVGQGSMLEPLQVVAVPPSTALVHNVLVVCHQREKGGGPFEAPRPINQGANPYQYLLDCVRPRDVVSYNNNHHNLNRPTTCAFTPQAAAGFVVVNNVSTDRGTLTILTPCSGDLPTNNLVLGKIEWMENVGGL